MTDTAPEAHREDVALAYRERRYGDMRKACEARLARNAGDADAAMWLGVAFMLERRWHEAIDAFDRALRVRVDPWSLANLGECYAKVGRLADAHYCYSAAKEVKPDFVDARIGLAAVLHGLRRFDEALAELDDAETLAADTSAIDVRRGCTLAEIGRYDQAQAAFAAASAFEPPYHRLVAFDAATYRAIVDADARASGQVGDVRVTRPDARAVVLVTADAVYARKYGRACLRSLASHAGGDVLVHVHLYDAGPEVAAELEGLALDAGLARCAVTTERSPFDAGAWPQRKAFYACGRFLHLAQLLEDYAVPVLSLDVDLVAERPLEAYFAAAPGVDLKLNRRHSIAAPWLDIVANIVVAYPTPAALEYLRGVREYILRHISQRDPWLLDQSALYCVLKMMDRFGTAPRVEWVPEAERLGLWHLGHGYDYLLADSRFRRYADPER